MNFISQSFSKEIDTYVALKGHGPEMFYWEHHLIKRNKQILTLAEEFRLDPQVNLER